jgi:2-polyprenyl-3-methyl-5-hydroxy-6-metoxy-1,4-benzoquinol methylase
MKNDVESLECPICSASRTVFVGRKNTYDVYNCRRCKQIYTRASHASDAEHVDLEKLYGDAYYGEKQDDRDLIARYDLGNVEEIKIKQFGEKLTIIKKYKSDGHLLDIGCSLGIFMREAQKRGYVCTGIDVSHYAVEYARNNFGLDVREGSFTEYKFDSKAFDIVTMWDILEHFGDPVKEMSEVYRILKDGGFLFINTLNSRCLRARLFGLKSWNEITPPEHQSIFSKKSIRLLMEKLGFSVLDVSTIHSDWIYRILRERRRYLRPLFHVSGFLGLGGDLFLVAKK